ncbi:hypothetical protein [Croceibacterium mercuriale]|uniref:hypothetical protein n=1 Tax=Croceibacterium mercuriale TaxID=1572751 RepID=UPI00126A3760|nr:hypothetical protein [Croceibacterium mercuriale]
MAVTTGSHVRNIAAIALATAVLSGCNILDNTIEGRNGVVYDVEHQDLGEVVLPSNSDLRMLDGDLEKYSANLCGLNDEADDPPRRCDVFVQAEPTSQLIGYVVLLETDEGVEIGTSFETNSDLGEASKSCWINDTIHQPGHDNDQLVRSSAKPFNGQIMYTAWERSPRDWVLSDYDSSAPVRFDISEVTGTWYIERTTDKLRITQDRFNFCYRDVVIDEVFTSAISFVKRNPS